MFFQEVNEEDFVYHPLGQKDVLWEIKRPRESKPNLEWEKHNARIICLHAQKNPVWDVTSIPTRFEMEVL